MWRSLKRRGLKATLDALTMQRMKEKGYKRIQSTVFFCWFVLFYNLAVKLKRRNDVFILNNESSFFLSYGLVKLRISLELCIIKK